jgi:hypothetical protein
LKPCLTLQRWCTAGCQDPAGFPVTVSQNEIVDRQIVIAEKHNLEIGDVVAVDVRPDDRIRAIE